MTSNDVSFQLSDWCVFKMASTILHAQLYEYERRFLCTCDNSVISTYAVSGLLGSPRGIFSCLRFVPLDYSLHGSPQWIVKGYEVRWPRWPFLYSETSTVRLRLKRDGTRTKTRFRLSSKRNSPFKSTGGVSSVDYWQPRCAHQR